MTDKRPETRIEDKNLTRTEPAAIKPFRMIERLTEEMERVFDDFGFGRGWLWPRLDFGVARPLTTGAETWLPDVEILQRKDDLLIRADLPGLAKDDVKIDITENAVVLQGERKREFEEDKAGVYRCERSYGTFYRRLPLPEGAITDQAKATFKDGLLEITMPAPPEWVKRGRRLEITDMTTQKK